MADFDALGDVLEVITGLILCFVLTVVVDMLVFSSVFDIGETSPTPLNEREADKTSMIVASDILVIIVAILCTLSA